MQLLRQCGSMRQSQSIGGFKGAYEKISEYPNEQYRDEKMTAGQADSTSIAILSVILNGLMPIPCSGGKVSKTR